MRGARGLYHLRIAELVWSVISTFSYLVLTRFDTGVILKWMRAGWVIWLLFSIVNLVLVLPFAEGLRGTRAEGVSRALIALLAVNLLIDVVQLVPEFGGPHLVPFGKPLEIATLLSSLAAGVCFFVALLRASPNPITFASIYWTLFGIGAALSLLQTSISYETYRELIIGPAGIAIRWLRFGCSVGDQIMVIVILKQLMIGGETPAAIRPPSTVSAAREILIGSIFLLGGLAVTLISYSAAAGGGRYVIASGAIAFGLVRLIRGLVRISGG